MLYSPKTAYFIITFFIAHTFLVLSSSNSISPVHISAVTQQQKDYLPRHGQEKADQETWWFIYTKKEIIKFLIYTENRLQEMRSLHSSNERALKVIKKEEDSVVKKYAEVLKHRSFTLNRLPQLEYTVDNFSLYFDLTMPQQLH